MSKLNNRKTMPAGQKVKLSQCMIVKNEENNIKKALEWGKSITFEQIVVDTGSTDRTVEIAKQMGAKIYHFEWINDFGAAKNYAIEQASGNWIAFLDADEYLLSEDSIKLINKLDRVESDPDESRKTSALKTQMFHLNDSGDTFSVGEQIRFFRNIKEIRYVGRIHEQLTIPREIVFYDGITIMHTGYSNSTYHETGKLERNEELLRAVLAENPDDMKITAYLADALYSKTRVEDNIDPDDIKEADELFHEVLNSDAEIPILLRKKTYKYFMEKIRKDPTGYTQIDELCCEAIEKFPDDLDFGYYYACILIKLEEYKKALDILTELEFMLMDDSGISEGLSGQIITEPAAIFGHALIAAQGLGDIDNVIKYATILLATDKSQEKILSPYIATLFKHGVSEEGVVELLGSIYDFGTMNDLLFIARAAKDAGQIEFAGIMMTIAGEML